LAKASKANARGEVSLDLGDRRVKLKLTLGVMADLEDELGIESLDDLPNSGKAIIKFLARLAKAAGEDVSEQEIREADLDLATVLEVLKALTGATQAGNAPAPGM